MEFINQSSKRMRLLHELFSPVYETETKGWNRDKCSAHFFYHLPTVCVAVARSQISLIIPINFMHQTVWLTARIEKLCIVSTRRKRQ